MAELKRKILITGGTGLVGSHVLLELLEEENVEIYATKRKQSDLTPLKQLFEWKAKSDLLAKICWIEVDLSSHLSPLDSFSFDEIIHTAAVVSFDPRDYSQMDLTNVKATERLIALAKRSGVKKIGFVSSIASLGRVVGQNKYTELSGWQDSPSNSYYSNTKYQAETLIINANSNELSTFIVNPGVILGPCDWNKSSGTFFKTGAKGILFYTKGKNGFVDVRDVAKGLLSVMNNGASGERHILVSENLSYQTVLNYLTEAFDRSPPKFYANRWLTNMGWRMNKFIAGIKGTSPTLTKESARTSHGIHLYENSKMVKELNFSFTPISTSIKDASSFFKQYYC